jgi:hypothetical protein
MYRSRALVVLAVAVLGHAGAPAAAQTLTIRGLGDAPLVVDAAAVERLGTVEVSDVREINAPSGRERIEIVYRGVELPRLLEAQGIERAGRALRTASVVVVSRDGYRATFSWGELFNTAVGRRVILILGENGRPNSAREGVFAIRSFSDLRPGPRHVRDVGEIRIEPAR